MSNALKFAAGSSTPVEYVDDVFQSYVRTGTGAEATITTNIDMTEGYMLWSKGRSGATDHAIYDSARGVTYDLVTNSTAAQTTQAQGLKSVSATGHTWGTLAKVNTNSATYVDWVFRKAPNFFDVVTYTGDGTSNQQIPHNLNIAPRMFTVKCTSHSSATDEAWHIWHYDVARDGLPGFKGLKFDTGGVTTYYLGADPTDTYINTGSTENKTGYTYVAYLFAHDTADDGFIQCGSFTTDGSGNATVNHGWTAGVQFAMIKASSTTGDWEMYDTARTSGWSGNDAMLAANLSDAESSTARLSASGTSVSFTGLSASQTYIYLFVVAP